MTSVIRAFFKEHTGLVLVCALFLCLGFLRLNDLSLYTPDSAQYLIWGHSIAHGKGLLDDTQPVPDRYVMHAPLYPVLIAPVELIFPLSVIAAKIVTLFWGTLAVILFYFWLRKLLGNGYALAAILLFTLNPLTLLFSSEVLSEAPFVAFMLLGFLFAGMIPDQQHTGRPLTIAIAVCAAVGALCREPGVALVLSFTLVFLLRKERAQAAAVIAASVVALGLWYLRNQVWIGPHAPSQTGNIAAVLQHYVTPPDAPMVNELVLRAWTKLQVYFRLLGGMLIYPLYATRQFSLNVMPSPVHRWIASVMAVASLGIVAAALTLMAWGLLLDFRRSASAPSRALFGVFYLLIILLFPVDDIRFLFPLLPLMIFYVLGGVRGCLERVRIDEPFRRPVVVAAAVFLMMAPNFSSISEILKLNLLYRKAPVAFAGSLMRFNSAPLMFTQPFAEMGEWIRSNLPDSAVIACPSKDLSLVVGSRKVWEIDQGAPVPVVENILRDNGIGYIVTPIRRQDIRVFECLLRESRRLRFERLYRVAGLELYRIHSRLMEPSAGADDTDEPLSPSFLAGRQLLLQGRYDAARAAFAGALRSDTANPDLLYQMVLASAFLSDSAGAMRYYRALFEAPQSLGYALPARQALQLEELLSRAEGQKMRESRAVEVFRVAMLYWKLGYPRRSAEIMNSVLETDSTYFIGLLWGLHFNLQVGDTVRAIHYLSVLRDIDKENPVVLAFQRIIAIGDSIGIARRPEDLGRLHLELARIYRQIELFDEAIDEAERTLRYVPDDADAILVKAQVYRSKGAARAALGEFRSYLGRRPDDSLALAAADSLLRALPAR